MDWQAVTVASEASAEPVHVEHAKKHCQVDINEDDTYIEGLITAAREKVEEITGRALVTQTLEARLDYFPCTRLLKVPRPPLVSVSSLRYTLSDGSISTIPSAHYIVDPYSSPGRVLLDEDDDWPTDELEPGPAVALRFIAGYATPISASAIGDLVTASGRTFADGDVVQFTNSGGALPTPLAERTDYYVQEKSGSSFKLAATAGGAVINLSDVGTGQSFIGRVPKKFMQAMLLLVGHWYENREAVQAARRSVILELPLGVRSLLLDKDWSF